MKITGIKLSELDGIGPIIIAAGLPPYKYPLILMSVETDEGITGNCFGWVYPLFMLKTGTEKLLQVAMGKDPFEVHQIVSTVTAFSASDYLTNIDAAISLFDICCWDIMGKKTGQPIYNLLGGKVKDKMPAYVSTPCYTTVDEYIEKCQWAIDHNFLGYKAHSSPNPDMDIEVCTKLREKFPHFKLMLDACGFYTMKDAMRIGKVIEDLDFEWYESPIKDDDFEGMKRLGETLRIPLSWGEAKHSMYRDVARYASERPSDILRTFGDLFGGITMMQRCAHVCDAAKIVFDPHSYGPTTVQAAHLHVMAAHLSSWWFELPINYEQFNVCSKDLLLPDENGYVHVPTKPGLGIELDYEEIERRKISEWHS